MIFGLAILAVLFFLLSIKWKSIAFGSLAVILFLALSIGIYNYEIPYQYISQGVVYEAVHTIESMWMLSWIFIGLTLISMLHLFILIFDMLKGRKVDVM
jgi:hypothetical protein